MSQTLFWAIVLTGSRSLGSDPTLLRGLVSEVLNIALTSFQSMRTLIDNIKGLLLLCTWPCPTTTILRDNTVALSGLLLNLSMQAGLHTPHTQFARFSGAGTENQSNERSQLATLWLYVVIACDRYGFAPRLRLTIHNLITIVLCPLVVMRYLPGL
jgi:transcriptional regulatory protein LEU3